MIRLLPDVFYSTKYQPWVLPEKYGSQWDTEKHREDRAKNQKKLQYEKDRMMHGSDVTGHSPDSPTYKKFKEKGNVAKDKLRSDTRTKGVKFYDKKGTGRIKDGKKHYD